LRALDEGRYLREFGSGQRQSSGLRSGVAITVVGWTSCLSLLAISN
jgi:hypothetical protein